MSDFYLSIKLILNEIKTKMNEFEFSIELLLDEINTEITSSYTYIYLNKTEIINSDENFNINKAETINSNAYFYINKTDIINSNHNYQIKFNLFLIVISLINLIYSFIIFKVKEKILIKAVSSEIFMISGLFHGSCVICSLTNLYKLFNKNIPMIKISINILKIICFIINWIFDLILFLYFDMDFLSIFTWIIIIYCLLWILSILDVYLVLEGSIWFVQIIKNFFYENKKIYPLFFIIIFTAEQLLKITLLTIYDNIPFPSKKKIIILIINILNIVILNIQPFLINKFIFCTKKIKNNNKLTKTKEELLFEKPNAKNEICAICLGQIFDTKSKKNDNINYKNIRKNLKTIIKNFFYIFTIYKSKLKRDYILIPCGHFFHKKCLRKWLRLEKECPLCRKTF